ncbi:TetR/AcrR family transcriptional regulator [uncultured Eubacterium sp.]|uniref:TetR/AcrR family transcriptional regulator n=1 Tax=uncultured Eubacterium sp. TaxID=165185 RepID=UPI0026711D0B|nr:TetR/AcrR family transcriptional regulator [uncultured Eubacterium sp.]
MGNTKDQILIDALNLFAKDGYEAVSVSQIAGALNITKGALYRHYKNKRDIFEHIVKRMEQGDSSQAENYDMPESDKESVPEQYQEITIENIVEYSKSMFVYWTEDDFASSFRKMLMLEQFRNEEMQALYQQYLVSGPLGYVKDLFESIGLEDAENKAVQFYGTMYFYYSFYDGAKDKKKVKEQLELAMKKIIGGEKNEE